MPLKMSADDFRLLFRVMEIDVDAGFSYKDFENKEQFILDIISLKKEEMKTSDELKKTVYLDERRKELEVELFSISRRLEETKQKFLVTSIRELSTN